MSSNEPTFIFPLPTIVVTVLKLLVDLLMMRLNFTFTFAQAGPSELLDEEHFLCIRHTYLCFFEDEKSKYPF